MTRDIGTAIGQALMSMMTVTGTGAARIQTGPAGRIIIDEIDATDWQVDPAAERKEPQPIYISPSLYAEAKAQGIDLAGYRAHEPIPIEPMDLLWSNPFGDDEAFPGLKRLANAPAFEPIRPRYNVRPDLAAPSFKSKRVKANRARKKAARKARRALK